LDNFFLLDWYAGEIKNRFIIHSDINLPVKQGLRLQLFIAVSLLLLKIVLSKVLSPPPFEKAKVLGLSWSDLHSKRLSDYAQTVEPLKLVRLNFYDWKGDKHGLFNAVSLRECWRRFRTLLSYKVPPEFLGSFCFDQIFYRAVFAIESVLLESILLEVDKVVIAGLNDRYSIIVAGYCEKRRIECQMVQHGLLSTRINLYRPRVDKYYNQFSSSVPLVSYSVDVSASEIEYLAANVDNKFSNLIDRSKYQSSFFIAVANSPLSAEVNREIVLLVLKNTPDYVGVFVYPHPVEKGEHYDFSHLDREVVVFDKKRHRDVDLVISHVSTIAVEYIEMGVEVMIVNVENLKGGVCQTSKIETIKTTTDLGIILLNKFFQN
jgi:hypothetical protein